MVAFFGGRPRFFFVLCSPSPPSPLVTSCAEDFGILGGRPLGRFGGGSSPVSSFFSCKSKTEYQLGFWREAKRGVDYSTMLTFGGRPRFLGVDGPSAGSGADAVGFLFLLPLGRPRPRLTEVSMVGEGSR